MLTSNASCTMQVVRMRLNRPLTLAEKVGLDFTLLLALALLRLSWTAP